MGFMSMEQFQQQTQISPTVQTQQSGTPQPISQGRAFKVFIKRYFIFLIIVSLAVFGMNKGLTIFSGNNYINSFFNLGTVNYYLEDNSPKNTLEKIKKELMFKQMDYLLKEKGGKGDYRFQFTLGDLSSAFKVQQKNYEKNDLFKDNFKEFENILKSIESFEKSKVLKPSGAYEAKKVFKIKKDNFSFAFDFLKKNKEYLIKLYDVQFANKNILRDVAEKVINKSYSIKITKKTAILYYKKENKNVEIMRFNMDKKSIISQLPVNSVEKDVIDFYQYLLTSFINKDKNYSVKQRNLWIVYPPEK